MSSSSLQTKLLLSDLKKPVISGDTRPEAWRRKQLGKISSLIENHEEDIIQSLYKDLKKPSTEAFFELIAIKQELKLAQKNLTRWMQPKKVNVPISLKPGQAMVTMEPIGTVLIIGPWNYPFSLTLQPLVSALAAGNTAVLKPSEKAPASSALISKLIPKYFEKDVVRVVEGDGNFAASLIEDSFDHIFFTGGCEIGRKVMKAAAKNMTPITLELGGKSPALVLKGSDLEISARRLIWGKCINAGQTCIAPDYLLVEDILKTELIEEMKKAMSSFYGGDSIKSKSLASIINKQQFDRLSKLLKGAAKDDQIIFGGEIDQENIRISPTLIEIKDLEDPLMSEEIFGPILPIITIKNLAEGIDYIKMLPKPLAIYLFGGKSNEEEQLINTTSSGSICINDVIMQAGIPELPFGGVGLSGMGRYHGISGFENFSNKKSIFKRPFWMDLNFRYPPYKINFDILKRLLA